MDESKVDPADETWDASEQNDASDLSIGDLARRSGLSAKALRLYDDSALLRPRRVDPFTAYRSYGEQQVERARLIARLRGLGMGLAQIRVVCDLPADGAARELRSWWLQEQADARTRSEGVASLLTDLQSSSQMESPMITTTQHTVPENADVATALDRGAVRPVQQDAVRVDALPGKRLLLTIADGFGTDDGLSERLLEALARSLEGSLARGRDPLPSLEDAWRTLPALLPADGTSGAALTAAIVEQDRLLLGHLGDGRALLVRGGRIEPLTRDHTHVASLVAAGRLTDEEAAAHPQRAVLNRALAADAPHEPDLIVRAVSPGDRLVLLSDGIHAVLAPESLGEALLASGPAREIVQDLTDRTIAAGAPDNLGTVVANLG